MANRDKRMKPGISPALAAKIRAAGQRKANEAGAQRRAGAIETLEDLRESAKAANQFHAAVQAEKIRAQLEDKADTPANADLSGLDDDVLRARLDTALAEIKRLAPKITAQDTPDSETMPDIFA